jgi:LmbE family N-acetylglucosaminyl deacetylase
VSVRLLGVFAHPDDQGLLCGGTFARYADGGADIITVCLAGAGADRGSTIASARRLGIRDVIVTDYSGGELAERGPELDAICIDLLRSLQPDVVITFGPDGMNRDPDHLAVHASTARAFFSLDRGRRSPLTKLYYGTWPQQHLRRALGALRARGLSTDFVPDAERWGSPDSSITTIIDVEGQLDRKLAAILEQSPQSSPLRQLSSATLADLWGHEFYRRAYPDPWVTGVIERDLLRGLATRPVGAGAPDAAKAS